MSDYIKYMYREYLEGRTRKKKSMRTSHYFQTPAPAY